MNAIAAVRGRSRHMPAPHLVITVDGTPLGEVLDAATPGPLDLEGLIPAMLGGLGDPLAELARARLLPPVGERAVAPLLICPDCGDVDCTTIVAEVVRTPDGVVWERIGIDRTEGLVTPTGRVGTRVEWLTELGPFAFDAAAYEAMVAAFLDGT